MKIPSHTTSNCTTIITFQKSPHNTPRSSTLRPMCHLSVWLPPIFRLTCPSSLGSPCVTICHPYVKPFHHHAPVCHLSVWLTPIFRLTCPSSLGKPCVTICQPYVKPFHHPCHLCVTYALPKRLLLSSCILPPCSYLSSSSSSTMQCP